MRRASKFLDERRARPCYNNILTERAGVEDQPEVARGRLVHRQGKTSQSPRAITGHPEVMGSKVQKVKVRLGPFRQRRRGISAVDRTMTGRR